MNNDNERRTIPQRRGTESVSSQPGDAETNRNVTASEPSASPRRASRPIPSRTIPQTPSDARRRTSQENASSRRDSNDAQNAVSSSRISPQTSYQGSVQGSQQVMPPRQGTPGAQPRATGTPGATGAQSHSVRRQSSGGVGASMPPARGLGDISTDTVDLRSLVRRL